MKITQEEAHYIVRRRLATIPQSDMTSQREYIKSILNKIRNSVLWLMGNVNALENDPESLSKLLQKYADIFEVSTEALDIVEEAGVTRKIYSRSHHS